MPAINPGISTSVTAYQNMASTSGASSQMQVRAQERMGGQNRADGTQARVSQQAGADTASFSSQALDALAAAQSSQSTQGAAAVNAAVRTESSSTRSSAQGSQDASAMIRQYQGNQAAASAESASSLASTGPAKASQVRINEMTGISGSDRSVSV